MNSPVHTVKLNTLVYGGEALGRLPDGRAVFVPFALPGETVRLRLLEEKRGHARAELLEVLEPSPERISPRCLHFGVCGGCHYQHMTYAAQLEAKRLILKDQLERIGGLQDPPVNLTVPSPREWYYRNHVQFALNREGELSYHKLRSNEVFAVRECHLPEEAINAAWPLLNFEPIRELERIGLRQGAGEEILLVLESEALEAPELSVEELDISVVHLSPAGPLVLAGSDHLILEVLGRPFRVSAGSFFQVNTPVAEAMLQHLLQRLPITPDSLVLDVYCGAGFFSAFFAPRAGRVIGIESNPYAADDFVANLDEFENVELYEAEAEEVLPWLEERPDVVVVDPPRAGLGRVVLDALIQLAPPQLAYISCDPSTLARDLKRLHEAGYRLLEATPFDMFPQTYHVECVVLMSRVDE